MESNECTSENASSICDEERIKRLFQACDTNGDGFIDNQDLLAVCRELSLEEYIDELMLELGADAQGRISYEQFLQRRLALRPEIEAIKGSKNIDNVSENSQGKGDSWEWDSGARDMSPVPKLLKKSDVNNRLLEEDFKNILAGIDVDIEGGSHNNCFTTYIFTPVETCTATSSPPRQEVNENDAGFDKKMRVQEKSPEEHPLARSKQICMDSYAINCDEKNTNEKITVGLSPLYTIGHQNDERTYDEPFSGDLPRTRSWLCCPGSQKQIEVEQPTFDEAKTPSSHDETITKAPSSCGFYGGACERLQQKLEEQSQRYEEQLTELHSVIAELTRKLHQQRSMAIVEEDEASEACTSAHEDSITCPLEVSELDGVENDLSDFDNKAIAESPTELPEPKLDSSHQETELSSEIIESLKLEIISLKAQLAETQAKFNKDCFNASSPDSHLESDYNARIVEDKFDIKYSSVVPIHKNISNLGVSNAPVTKVAERIKLKRATDGPREVKPNDLVNTDLPTAIAEHIVGDILRQCDVQNEKHTVDLELRTLTAKLEHTRAQNSVLALTLSETKSHCDRLALLCGKYESNAIALRLALGVMDRAVEAYDVLLALLETELALSSDSEETLKNRIAAESIAKQLLQHLDMYQDTDVLLSPWQNRIFNSPTNDSIEQPWTAEQEVRLRDHVSRLKAERSTIQGTYVVLESPQVESATIKVNSIQESRKMDLEMAVLIQELMGLREEKVELISKLYTLEKDKNALELKLKYVEGQQKAQAATLKNLQGQLKDTEGLLAIATQNKVTTVIWKRLILNVFFKERGYSDAEHAQGVELELIQALAREARLKIRLQELVSTLEQVTRNAEARLLEGREMVHDLNNTNSILAETVDRNHKKYQARLSKMEQQMLNMVERHNVQVETLQRRIAALETPQTNSSENSASSVAM
ncbi:hypothetical protein FQR65_LT04953 [Abscondita terminalis]|nr:hypothetical protein FQR65_LT04953 [Abscondita terminalis]